MNACLHAEIEEERSTYVHTGAGGERAWFSARGGDDRESRPEEVAYGARGQGHGRETNGGASRYVRTIHYR